jgi:hypothetical protein
MKMLQNQNAPKSKSSKIKILPDKILQYGPSELRRSASKVETFAREHHDHLEKQRKLLAANKDHKQRHLNKVAMYRGQLTNQILHENQEEMWGNPAKRQDTYNVDKLEQLPEGARPKQPQYKEHVGC